MVPLCWPLLVEDETVVVPREVYVIKLNEVICVNLFKLYPVDVVDNELGRVSPVVVVKI